MVDTAMAPSVLAEGELRIGAVFGRSFSILGRNFVLIFGIAAIAALPDLYNDLTTPIETLNRLGANGASVGTIHRQMTPFSYSEVLALIAEMLGQAVIVDAVIQTMNGRKPRLGQSVSRAFSRLLPIIGLFFSEVLMLALGFLLLIVPGIILLTIWFVALPVCIVEKLGPFKSMARSGTLTKGSRWKIFGIMAIPGIGGAIVAATTNAIFLATVNHPGLVISQYLIQIASVAIPSVISAVVYRDLRVIKEGADIETIAAVFN